ncbi:alpha-amylase family glycosyl hydrolase [Escherichia coli]|uniref:alpha-amylase family glycosyl hydrolase n=1 Tax=Escherichia coli TaxID=562 RepID=UPI002FF2B733
MLTTNVSFNTRNPQNIPSDRQGRSSDVPSGADYDPEQTLIKMSALLAQVGTHPDDIVLRSQLDHTLAEEAIYQICLKHYTSEGHFPDMTISLSTYNPEEEDTKKAIKLASHDFFDDNGEHKLAKCNEIINERRTVLLERFLKDNPDKTESDFILSEDEEARIQTVTYDDVVEHYRTQFRLARQAAERSQTHPGRTIRDGGRLATYLHKMILFPSTENDGSNFHLWGSPAVKINYSAIHYDVKYHGNVSTVYLDILSLFERIKYIPRPDGNLTIYEQMEINALMGKPDSPGHTMLHAFNTPYANITLQADKLKEAGISHVLTSPPLTWRDNGPLTPSDEKGMWYHVYQPEDIRFVENPHGNLQSYVEMITVLQARGIEVIADIPLNFMGIGGDGGAGGNDKKGTLQYPSTDILDERTESIRRGTRRIEGQTLLRTLTKKSTGEIFQQLPNKSFTSVDDFEPSKSDVSDWTNLENIRHNRLNGMPKVSPESTWILDAQRDYLQALKDLGVKGFRIDAEKHMTSQQLNHVLTPEITEGMFVFGETITPGGEDSAWVDYLHPRLNERTDIGAYDFPLQAKLISAFRWGGSLQELRMTDGYMPSPIPPFQSVTFVVNHDIPNNGNIFGHMLFGHPDDEKLANAYILSLPGRMPLIYSDGKAQTSVTEVLRENAPSLGGDAWTTTGWRSMSSMIKFHNKLHKQSYMWFAYEGDLASPTCLAFSRGDSPVGTDGSDHFALVIINKADQEISPVSWPNKLKPGRYKDYGPGNKGEFTVGVDGKFIPELKIEKRTALMLAWEKSIDE